MNPVQLTRAQVTALAGAGLDEPHLPDLRDLLASSRSVVDVLHSTRTGSESTRIHVCAGRLVAHSEADGDAAAPVHVLDEALLSAGVAQLTRLGARPPSAEPAFTASVDAVVQAVLEGGDAPWAPDCPEPAVWRLDHRPARGFPQRLVVLDLQGEGGYWEAAPGDGPVRWQPTTASQLWLRIASALAPVLTPGRAAA